MEDNKRNGNKMMTVMKNCMMEWSFCSSKKYRDPFNDVDVSVIFKDPAGNEKTVPAFWSGENIWRVRFSSETCGRFSYKSVSSEVSDRGLHGKEGEFEVAGYEGKNPLFAHGPIRVSADKRYFEHGDGTPFFWLGDTWWLGLCRRLKWPEDFQMLTADRTRKGFSVIQIVAGLYPDMPAFDERGANEAGFPWEKDYARINPAYFDAADIRLNWLVRSGLVACIVGCWGYFLPWMGLEKMKKHWRYLVGRYGALPVVWCLAGEGIMPYYLSKDKEKDAAFQKKGWTEIARYVREIDAYHRPITIHPTAPNCGRNQVEDASVLDFDMLQTGHNDMASVPDAIRQVVESAAHKPKMPVINGEVCYEGICGGNWQNVQRFMFWTCILSGTAGHTYGANGIWQVNTRERPYGPSPGGYSWGNTPWEDAFSLPGSGQLGLGKRLMERYEWWRFEPHPEWVEPHRSNEEYFYPFAAGIPKEVRIFFTGSSTMVIKGIERNISYRGFWFDPATGEEQSIGIIRGDKKGHWKIPVLPILQYWVLVLERAKRKEN